MTLDLGAIWDDFGTLLRNFVELSSFNSFSSNKALYELWVDAVLFNGKENYCQDLKTKEKWLHQVFKNLSLLVGFDETEATSVFEIPSLISDGDYDELRLGSIPKVAYYSRCEVNKTFRNVEKSLIFWNKYVENNKLQGNT